MDGLPGASERQEARLPETEPPVSTPELFTIRCRQAALGRSPPPTRTFTHRESGPGCLLWLQSQTHPGPLPPAGGGGDWHRP